MDCCVSSQAFWAAEDVQKTQFSGSVGIVMVQTLAFSSFACSPTYT